MPKDTHLVSGRAEILICIYFSVRNKISDMVLKTQSLNFGNDKNLNWLKRKKKWQESHFWLQEEINAYPQS